MQNKPAKASVSPRSSPPGTFRKEERLRISDRNSILMTQSNVYIMNSVVYGVSNTNLSNFTCLLVDFGKLLCSSANELQQNSRASSREDYISTNIDCFVRDSSRLHLTFVAFCLLSVIRKQ